MDLLNLISFNFFLDAKWHDLYITLETKCLKETCIEFQTINERWKKGKDEGLANNCSKICKVNLNICFCIEYIYLIFI